MTTAPHRAVLTHQRIALAAAYDAAQAPAGSLERLCKAAEDAARILRAVSAISPWDAPSATAFGRAMVDGCAWLSLAGDAAWRDMTLELGTDACTGEAAIAMVAGDAAARHLRAAGRGALLVAGLPVPADIEDRAAEALEHADG
ncbi:hypothetical protein WDZ11_00050 (plasmid) [Roseomonas mucosa]|uniref:hypothetical protein n=1 Tax=Roseomonas mucosa TaxID=207340 RepID=UPI0030CFF299